MKWVTNLLCLLLLGIALQGEAVSVENLQLRRAPMHKAKPETDDEPAVVKVENHVRKHAKQAKGRLMDMIDKFRAEICYKMHDEFGVKFETFEACHKFMVKTCKPGKDMTMDGDDHEVSSGEGYCKQYFPQAKKKAEAAIAKEDAEEVTEEEEYVVASGGASPGPAPGSAPAPNAVPAPAPKVAAEAPAAAAGSPGPAPAPGPMGAPGPGPAPGPFTPGISGGKPWGEIAKDEAYYYKDGGKDNSRMHMSEKLGLPTQGYWGKLVEHEDGETQTGDWGKEFGPKSGHDSVQKICMHRPDNEWCRRRGYGPHKAAASPAFKQLLAVAIAIFVTAAF